MERAGLCRRTTSQLHRKVRLLCGCRLISSRVNARALRLGSGPAVANCSRSILHVEMSMRLYLTFQFSNLCDIMHTSPCKRQVCLMLALYACAVRLECEAGDQMVAVLFVH